MNKVFLIGNLGKDPEIRYTQSGTPVTTFNLAINESYKDQSGEWQQRTTWLNIVAWGEGPTKKGLQKGDKVFIEGKIQIQQYEQNGQKKRSTKIVAYKIIPFASYQEPPENQEGAVFQDDDDDAPF